MGEPQEKMPKSLELLLQDTKLLRKLVQQGIDSGTPREFTFDEIRSKARAKLEQALKNR